MPVDAQDPISELSAVNILLGVVGQAPIATLDNPVLGVQVAINVLAEVSRSFQTTGWSFNTQSDATLAPGDEDANRIPLTNILKVTAPRKRLTVRGGYLFDADRYSDDFENTTCTGLSIVHALVFDDMPPPARYYVAVRAARTYQKRVLGEQSLDRFTAEDEYNALTTFLESEGDAETYSIFDHPDVAGILPRYWNR